MNKNRLKTKDLVVIVIFLAGMTMFSGCEKAPKNKPNEIEGIYVGTYTWTNLTRDWSWNTTPTIELRDGKYTYKGLSNDGYYDSGSGNFTISGDKIIFELTYYDIPIEYIGVVDSWLLKGEYKCEFGENKLIFSKTATVMADMYEYVFELNKDASR